MSLLEGDIAIITGSASGIGKAIALRFARAGASVVAFDRDRHGADATRAEITAVGGAALAVTGDSADEQQVKAAIAETVETFGSPSILVNAAGVGEGALGFLEITSSDWHRIIDVDLNGYFYFLHECVPLMIGRGGGRVLQIASVAAYGDSSKAAYAVAKAGVVVLTRRLSSELAGHNIRVNSISPGFIETGLTRERLSKDASGRDRILAATPTGRFGRSEDIAEAALFLVGPHSEFVNGADLVVDGGLRNHRAVIGLRGR